MVKGIEKFREAMLPYRNHFVIIGGTACDIRLTGSTMIPRATVDIDIIVVVEKMSQAFVDAFWAFIKAGNYRIERRVNQAGNSVYALYRFILQGENFEYPQQIELLSRHSDLLGEPSGFHIEPLPTDEDHQSLSAIIMDDIYYDFTVQQVDNNDINELNIANNLSLIALKTNAYLNLLADKNAGKHVNSNDIKKHRSDVLKLVAAGSYPEVVTVNQKIYDRVIEFVEQVQDKTNSLAAALGTTEEIVQSYLSVLRNEIFKPQA